MGKSTANLDEWFTSSYSSGNGQCVQVRCQEENIGVRDSVPPERALLDFPQKEWQAFIDSTKDA